MECFAVKTPSLPLSVASPLAARYGRTQSPAPLGAEDAISDSMRPVQPAREPLVLSILAATAVVVAFVGFAPTYWLQLSPGTFIGTPLVHLHAVLFSAWPLYLLVQTTLAARGRIARHRAWGLLGVSLATAMVLVGFAVANDALTTRLAAGYGDAARAFHIASISMITLFGGFVFAAHPLRVTARDPQAADVARDRLDARAGDRAGVVRSECGYRPGLRPGFGPPRTVERAAPALIADALIVAA